MFVITVNELPKVNIGQMVLRDSNGNNYVGASINSYEIVEVRDNSGTLTGYSIKVQVLLNDRASTEDTFYLEVVHLRSSHQQLMRIILTIQEFYQRFDI